MLPAAKSGGSISRKEACAKMTKYESAILFDPELPEERRKEFLAKIEGIVTSFEGEILKQDDWGIRKLAYHIRKKQNAYYTFLIYSGKQGVVEEVERNIKIFDVPRGLRGQAGRGGAGHGGNTLRRGERRGVSRNPPARGRGAPRVGGRGKRWLPSTV